MALRSIRPKKKLTPEEIELVATALLKKNGCYNNGQPTHDDEGNLVSSNHSIGTRGEVISLSEVPKSYQFWPDLTIPGTSKGKK